MGSGLDNSDSDAGSGVWIFNIAVFLLTDVVYTQSSIQWVRSNVAKWLHHEPGFAKVCALWHGTQTQDQVCGFGHTFRGHVNTLNARVRLFI
jgi:hypothetical protein